VSKSNSGSDEIFNEITKNSAKSSVLYRTSHFFFNNREKDLNIVAQEYVQADGTKRNITIFIGRLEDAIGDLVRKKSIDGLLWKSREAVLKIAECRNIPIDKYVYTIEPHENHECQHIIAGLNFALRGANQMIFTRENLRWANCLVEFYSGKSLFKEENKLKNVDTTIPKTLDQLQKKMASEANLQQPPSEEKIIFNLWQQGFLQCDRVN
jgi:hypothetical protein